MDIQERLSFFAALYRVDENPEAGMWYLYLTIFGLCIVVYQLGFAKKLPLLKNIVIYAIMALGCTILCFFASISSYGRGTYYCGYCTSIYRLRLRNIKREEQA